MPLELASINTGTRGTPTMAEIWAMDEFQIMEIGMRKLASVGRWKDSAKVASWLEKARRARAKAHARADRADGGG
jgi:hypothetical protein